MIGRLAGILLSKQPPNLLIDVGGVGYDVEVSMQTFFQCPNIGEKLVLLTQFIVRADAQLLYGFISEQERTLFRQLIKINGVGPKLALAILSSTTPQQFMTLVSLQDTATLCKFPGIGKKTAERLIIEMRDKTITALPMATTPMSSEQDAIGALISLGYKPLQASQMIKAVATDTLDSSEALIKAALRSHAIPS